MDKNGQGYDVATVLLEANADRIYQTASDLLKGNPQLTITYSKDASREIEFSDGTLLVGMKVSRLEEKVSQLLISSIITPGERSGTSVVLEKVNQICEKLGVRCSVAKE